MTLRYSWLSTDSDDIKHSCHASELLALFWISYPYCFRIVFSCRAMSVAKLHLFHKKINDNHDNNLSQSRNEQMRKIPYIHDIFYFKKKKKKSWLGSWLTRGWLVTRGWLGLVLGSCNATTRLFQFKQSQSLPTHLKVFYKNKHKKDGISRDLQFKTEFINIDLASRMARATLQLENSRAADLFRQNRWVDHFKIQGSNIAKFLCPQERFGSSL